MHITAQGLRLRNDLYCVEWDIKLYYTIPWMNCSGLWLKSGIILDDSPDPDDFDEVDIDSLITSDLL